MKNEHPIAALAEALEVSPSGFHAHQRKAQGQRRREDAELSAAIGPIFAASRQTYGCPRVTAALRQSGVRCGKNRVARLMRENALRPKQKRKRWRPVTTDSSHRQPIAENWLARVPAPDQPDQMWVADITYLDTGEGWLYLAGILGALGYYSPVDFENSLSETSGQVHPAPGALARTVEVLGKMRGVLLQPLEHTRIQLRRKGPVHGCRHEPPTPYPRQVANGVVLGRVHTT